MFELIRSSMFEEKCTAMIDASVYEEMCLHSIGSLPAYILKEIEMPAETRENWKKLILQQISHYTKYTYNQSNIKLNVPYVILKGTSASQYYPHPELRTMGDIDIITRREDFDAAVQQLLNDGYIIIEKLNREISFKKRDTIIELHKYFASLNNIEQAMYMDNLIIDNITSSHILPDPINGLVLLEHISQHLENGLGLRQIIDWMMFVDKCLPDEKWVEFEIMAENIGLKKLAIVTTHMCELYMGLPTRKWCSDADDKLCKQLMDYILVCGNFGKKKTSAENISENVFAKAGTFQTAFKLLQRRGLYNWKAAKKYKVLRPFAWVYQATRYICKGLNREKAGTKLKEEYRAARRRNDMFEALGVKMSNKGIVIYKDGKYIKK